MKLVRGLVLLLAIGGLAGCSELRARSHAREGNRFFRDGDFAAAVREYQQAERLYPGLPAVRLNLGLACRQLMVPGAKGPENQRVTDCALKAFQGLKQVSPKDRRAERLYTQTLFDADRFEELTTLFERQVRENPKNLAAINSLIQVYSRWNRPEQALHWMIRRADVEQHDAEAQYAVGVLVQNLLFARGGGNDKSTFDPRPDPNSEVEKTPPVFASGEIAGEERIKLADVGISHLEKAMSLRPNYRDAMVFINLLYRQKSLAYLDQPAKWQECVDAAERWRNKALALPAAHKAAG